MLENISTWKIMLCILYIILITIWNIFWGGQLYSAVVRKNKVMFWFMIFINLLAIPYYFMKSKLFGKKKLLS